MWLAWSGDFWSTVVSTCSAMAGNLEIYLGSADLMPRNIDSRVEALAPVSDSNLIAELCEILEVQLADNANAALLQADGTYTRVEAATTPVLDSHQYFIDQAESGDVLSP